MPPDSVPAGLDPTVQQSGAAGNEHPARPVVRPPRCRRLKSRQRSWTASLRRVATQHELVRALHASLEPRHIARLLVDHLAEVMPLTCWTVVAPDLDDQLVILADSRHGLGHFPPLVFKMNAAEFAQLTRASGSAAPVKVIASRSPASRHSTR